MDDAKVTVSNFEDKVRKDLVDFLISKDALDKHVHSMSARMSGC